MEEMIGFVIGICVLMTINALMAARVKNDKVNWHFCQWGHLPKLVACGWQLKKEWSWQLEGCGQWQALSKHNHQFKNEPAIPGNAGGMQRHIAMLSVVAKRDRLPHHGKPLHLCMGGVDPPHLKRRGLNLIVDNQRLRAEIEEGRS